MTQRNVKNIASQTESGLRDIIRSDLLVEKTKFRKHVQSKIDKLDEKMVFTNYKFEDVQYWFRTYSLSIIFMATFLTLVEALITGFDLTSLILNDTLRDFIEFVPLILSSLISFTGAVIKFNEYEESIEEITRANEKGHSAMAKLKEICEELHFCYRVDKFQEIHIRYTNDIYSVYLDCLNALDRQLSGDDIDKYTKKYSDSDVRKLKIIMDREKKINRYADKELTTNIYQEYTKRNREKKGRNFLFGRNGNIFPSFKPIFSLNLQRSPPSDNNHNNINMEIDNKSPIKSRNSINSKSYNKTKLNKSVINGKNICLRSATNRNMLPPNLRNLSPNPSRAITPDSISLDGNSIPNSPPVNVCNFCEREINSNYKFCPYCKNKLNSETNSSNNSSGGSRMINLKQLTSRLIGLETYNNDQIDAAKLITSRMKYLLYKKKKFN